MIIDGRLPRSKASLQGVSELGIKQFFETIQNQNIELHSMILVRHGHVIAEHWWKPFAKDKPHMLFSLSKSFTSTAVGLAVSEGLLSENDSVLKFFPEYVTPETSTNLANMQIRHLLSMSTGHVEDTMPYLHHSEDGDWVKSFLQVPIQRTPGTHFLYNTGATYMLSAILQRVSGQTLLEYLTPRLFDPLEIINPTWETCPRGINTGGFGLSIRTEDIAKFGELYLRRGVWLDQQIIPETWVDTSTRMHISNGDDAASDWAQGYGYQFWRCRHNAYRGDGAFGQYCVVMPEEDAVLAITSGVQDMQVVLDAVWETILPALSGAVSAEDNSGVDFNDPEAIAGPTGVNPNNRVIPSWANTWYTALDHSLSMDRVKFVFDSEGFTVHVIDEGMEWTLQGGYLEWKENERLHVLPQYSEQEVAIQGGWRSESTFVMALCLCRTPFTYNITVTPNDEGLSLTVSVNVGFGELSEKVIQATVC